MSDLFSIIGAVIVGVAAAIGGLFTPVNNASVSHVGTQFDNAFAAVDNISYPSSLPVGSNNVSRNVSTGKTDNVVEVNSNLAEENDADLSKVESSVSDSVVGYNKLLPGGVFSYSYQDYVPDLTGATERDMQSAYLYCVNHEIKSGVYILDEKMPLLYDVEHPERYYGKVKASAYTCVDDVRFVFASNDYCVAVKKLFSGANCNNIDTTGTKSVNEVTRRMEEHDQKVGPITDDGRKSLLTHCIEYNRQILVNVGTGDTWSELKEAHTCANRLADKFGDSKYCAVVSSVYPGVKCYSGLLNVSPRVLPKTFQEWDDLQTRFGLD